ncbi:hypothetical protein ABPG75_004717 [Micractinium tetrahymenae]
MALQGKVAIVTGATGIVGEGIARAFLQAGATVVAPVRDAGKEAGLRSALGSPPADRLVTPVDAYTTAEGSKQLARFVQLKYGAVDHVVACTGGMVPMGLLSTVTREAFNTAAHDRVLGQLYLAQALAPLLKEEAGSSYTVITGRLGEHCNMPDGALFCIANAAVYGLVQALQAELRSKPQRVNELRIGAIVRRDGKAEHPHFPGKRSHPASLVGAQAVAIAAGSQSEEIIRLYLDD